jgi:hypothetical protein
MPERTLRGQAAIIGIGESTYYRHGRSPDSEFVLALKAITAACEDAGMKPEAIGGFCSYSNDRNGPIRLAAALNIESAWVSRRLQSLERLELWKQRIRPQSGIRLFSAVLGRKDMSWQSDIRRCSGLRAGGVAWRPWDTSVLHVAAE